MVHASFEAIPIILNQQFANKQLSITIAKQLEMGTLLVYTLGQYSGFPYYFRFFKMYGSSQCICIDQNGQELFIGHEAMLLGLCRIGTENDLMDYMVRRL